MRQRQRIFSAEEIDEEDDLVESLDYDLFESVVNQSGLEIQYREGREKNRLVIARWGCTLAIGIATAVIAICMLYCTTRIGFFKRNLLQNNIASEKIGTSPPGSAYGNLVLLNLTFVLLATSAIVFGAEIASGSGISEIKTTLNGVKLPHVLRLKTLVCKVLGTICSVSGGLPVGKEGPMIHSGAIMGAGLSQGKSSTLGYDTSFSYFIPFRNDREKRDFVICGAAAGVAAAFGAPFGGVLFVLEEGASFWHQSLTWRTSLCAVIATFTLTFFISGFEDKKWGTLGSQTGTFSFGQFNSSTYEVWEVGVFILMGIGGGLSGATFNWLNTKITYVRSRWITTPIRCLFEAAILSFVVSSVSFGLPYFFGQCVQRPEHPTTEYPYRKEMVGFYCPDEQNQHNDLATLFLSPGEVAIKQLFHAPPGTFDVFNLVLFYIVSTALACWTYGLKVPSGLFVPALLIGAAYGRLWTRVINYVSKEAGAKLVDARTYGLIGGAAMLGGVTRMTISLTVILLECTGNIQYGLPVITTLFAARFVGNYFNEGIYDIHIHLRHLPFLDWSPPLLGTFLRVKHVMTQNPKCVRVIERAGAIYDLLTNTTHNGFPVVSVNNSDTKFFAGIVLRKQLSVILKRRDFLTEKPNEAFCREPEGRDGCLSYRDMEGHYPRYPKTNELEMTEEERHLWVDLSPYMNETPYLLQEDAAFTRAYRLFRSSGLRHLVVVNKFNSVKGIVTRRDLEADHCSRCFRLACLSHEILYPSSPALPPSRDTKDGYSSRKRASKLNLLHRKRTMRKNQVTRALQMPLLNLDGGSVSPPPPNPGAHV